MRVAIDGRKIADFGIGTYIRGLLQGLAEIRDGEEYVVIAPESAQGIPKGFEHVRSDAPHYSLRELLSVGRAAERAGADLLHAPHYVVPLTRLPVVVTIHDLIHLHVAHRNPLARVYAKRMLRRAVSRSARVLTVTAAVRVEILQTFQCDPEKVLVTPNGIADAFRASAANPSPSRYFLYVGNDKPHKNVERLVEAFARVRASYPEVSLVLAGGPFERFQAVAGVITPGFVAERELVALYRGALALVQPSLEEGFGLPVAEAMASGVAAITSRSPALLEVAGDAALDADATSVAEIAEAMARIASDDALRLALARRGIERAGSMTWVRCAELTRRAYVDAAAK